MTIVVSSLLISCLFLFLYFAYRDSQLSSRLDELEAKIVSPPSSNQQSGILLCLVVQQFHSQHSLFVYGLFCYKEYEFVKLDR